MRALSAELPAAMQPELRAYPEEMQLELAKRVEKMTKLFLALDIEADVSRIEVWVESTLGIEYRCLLLGMRDLVAKWEAGKGTPKVADLLVYATPHERKRLAVIEQGARESARLLASGE